MLQRPTMRVLHYGKYFPPVRGGIETVVAEICRGLVRKDVEVTALVSNDTPHTREEQVCGVRVIRVARQTELSSQPINWPLLQILRGLEFDILHFHAPNPLGALLSLAGNVKQAPIVVSHHSDIVRQKWLGVPAGYAQRNLYRRAAAIVVATPAHVTYSKSLYGLEHLCRVIHYPLDPSVFEKTAIESADPVRLPWGTEPFALFIGRLVYYKGLDVLLTALARTPLLRVAIVGTGPLDAALRKQAAELGIDKRVAFLGDVTNQQLLSLCQQCTLLTLPSTAPSEAFGMVQLEAMAAGKPVVSTRLKSGVPYVNRHAVTGLTVPPGDATALAEAMLELLARPEYSRTLGANGKQRVFDEFHIDRVVSEHIALYRSLLAG